MDAIAFFRILEEMPRGLSAGALYVGGEGELLLFDSGQFQRVCNDLPRPTSQMPRVIHFVGRQQKTLALKKILANNNVQRSPTQYFAGLRADLSTCNHDSPLLFLDSDPVSTTTDLRLHDVQSFQSHPLLWLREGADTKIVSDALHARLLFTIADLICVFLDDFSDIYDLTQQLEDWCRLGPASRHDGLVRPRLLVVSMGSDLPITAAGRLRKMQDTLSENFSIVQPLFLGGHALSPLARYQRLKDAIISHSADIHQLKRQRYLAFSALHLAEIFRATTLHCAKTLTVPCDILSIARPQSGQQRNISQHVSRFFQLCQQHRVTYSDTVRAVASALLVDAYPPGMHRGLIELGIFTVPMDIVACSKLFDEISHTIFGARKNQNSLVASVKKAFRSWTSDGLHDASQYQESLKSVLGPHTRLFGAPHGHTSGYRCAVVTSCIADAKPVLISNYNGLDQDGLCNGKLYISSPQIPSNSVAGYEILRPENVEEEPYIWEAARATSAAPVYGDPYVTAVVIANDGRLFQTTRVIDRDLQDGGLKYNNPCLLALWESRRLWPDIKNPDLFLSLGTGQPKVLGTRPARFRHFLLDGFIPRLFRSCLAKTDGDMHWGQMMNSLDDHSRTAYFRMNIPLSGPALIGDLDSMSELRQRVRRDVKLSITMLEVANMVVASSFYFQLDCVPCPTRWGYLVQGSIRCRSDVRQVQGAMSNLGMTSVGYSTGTKKLCGLGELDADICDACHRYRKQVHFHVRDLSASISIFMVSRAMAQHKLSGFPETVDWFQRQQGLCVGAVFGQEHHGIPGRFHCSSCDATAGSNHKRTKIQQSPKLKKRVRIHEAIAEVELEKN
ncbi:hypothetical protein H2204_011718 [Knufia peltigerae]|uniref:PNPLA domain-containing protein n=1 Tax=Knufia peltigerae TaxID=1002370 RepID=A0AA39CRK6_9EURO|nr:hypothetical protein H2204_011718 [Knufia peltigerae]